MKLTLISATYNSENTISDAISSVLSQTNVDVETLVIDGISSDTTLAQVQRLANSDSRVLCNSERDHGIYDALNKGIRSANGDIIGFVHSDDLLASKDVLSKVMQEFLKNGVDGVYGDLHYIDALNPDKIVRNWKSRPFKRSLLKKGWMPAHPTLFLRKEVYEKHGGFDLQYKIAADYDFMVRILKDPELKFSYLPEVITKMRVGGASNRSLPNIIRKSREDYHIIRKHKIGGLGTLFLKNFNKLQQFIN